MVAQVFYSIALQEANNIPQSHKDHKVPKERNCIYMIDQLLSVLRVFEGDK